MDALSQAAALLALPLFEQGADGVLQLNDAARALGDGGLGQASLGSDFAAVVARAAGCADDDARLLGALDTARDGCAATAILDTARVVLMPNGSGGLRAMVLAGSAEIERRAALTDAAAEVAHEVANALSAIAGWAEIGRGQRQRERVDEALDRIETSARAAREAARGLLGAARGSVIVEGGLVAVDASALALDVARTLAPIAAMRGVRIDAAAAGVAPVADPSGKLWTVLWNLLKNAIEAATDGGLVELRVEAAARGVRVIIADDGPGMDVAARERAFEPYVTTKADGTGLGLPLVKRAVEALGGTIVLEGRRSGGLRAVVSLPAAYETSGRATRPITTRTITPRPITPRAATARALPAADVPPRAPPARPAGGRTPSLRPAAVRPATVRPAPVRTAQRKETSRSQALRARGGAGPARDSGVRNRAGLAGRVVLVVEDDTALRELVATTLELRGARVTAVASGRAASALSGPFDLAIIDLTLGDTRGDHVLAELRARGALCGPAIVATGRALPELLEAEPDAVLRKPFAIDEMTELVGELIDAPPKRSAKPG